MAFRGKVTAVRIFVSLQVVLVLLGLFEIVATIYLSFYGPKSAIGEASRLIILVTSTLSVAFPLFRWRLHTIRNSIRFQAWRRDLHPASILYLCILVCLWIAGGPSTVIKAFDRDQCNATTTTLRGSIRSSSCLLIKIKAILAAVMAAITFILLLFLTCSSSLFPQPCPCRQRTANMSERLPSHLRDTSFRSFSDSQTLRPSYDIEYLYPKIRAPILPRQQRQSKFNLLPKLPPFDQLTPLDLDHPSIHPSSKQEVLDPFGNVSQSNLLPSPLALSPMAPLPLRPNRTTSMGSHPPLSRSQTARTAASSIYSRSVCTDELFSRHPSPLSSLSDTSHRGTAGESIRLQAKSPIRPPTPHNQQKEQAPSTPARPESKPAMPPASFWMYARQAHEEQDSHKGATSINNPFVTDGPQSLPSYPLGHTRNAKSKTQDISVKNEEGSPCYEKYRKGPGSPLWSGKSDFDRRLAAAMSGTKVSTSKSVHHREKTNGGKVSKSRWPSTAF